MDLLCLVGPRLQLTLQPVKHVLVLGDPMTGKYGLVIANVIRIAGAVTLLVLGIFLFLMFRQEKYGPHPPRALQPAAAQGLKTNVRPGWKG